MYCERYHVILLWYVVIIQTHIDINSQFVTDYTSSPLEISGIDALYTGRSGSHIGNTPQLRVVGVMRANTRFRGNCC